MFDEYCFHSIFWIHIRQVNLRTLNNHILNIQVLNIYTINNLMQQPPLINRFSN